MVDLAKARAQVCVRVPASTANLGPGFDALGLALALYNEVTISWAASGLELTVEGEGGDHLGEEGERSLVVRAARATFAALDVRPPGLRVHLTNRIPLRRGLGSSATAALAGVLGAAALAGKALIPEEVLQLALQFEGHPDNLTPSLVGGFTVSCLEGERVRFLQVPLGVALSVVAVIPEAELSTAEARRVLPSLIPLRDAVFNLGRTALLVAALTTGRLECLDAASRDRLHQPYRGKLIAGMEEVLEAARQAGAAAAFLSGAGPTLVALVPHEEAVARRVGTQMVEHWKAHGTSSRFLILEVDTQGAILTDGAQGGER